MRLKSETLHKIGMSSFAPVWLKMWCLRAIFRNIQMHIEQLPPEHRQKFHDAGLKSGRFSA